MNSKINWYEKDAKEVADYIYKETGKGKDERFETLKYLIQNFPELEINWHTIFIEMKYELFMKERIDDILFFVNWYSTKYPADYKRSYHYVERVLCSYYLYKGDYDALQERMGFIQQNPVRAIDTLTKSLLFQLIYHGQYQKAVTFAEAVWKPLEESDELVGGAANDFVDTVYLNKFQQYYESLLNNIPFDVEAMFASVVEMELSDEREGFDKIISKIKGGIDTAFLKDLILEKNEARALKHLNIHFLKFMYQQYHLPFIFSECIWDFVNTKKLFGKYEGIENWFYIDVPTLSEYTLAQYDTLFRNNVIEIFGKVWGLNYVFEFLNHYQLIPADKYEIMQENIAHFKNEMIGLLGSELWKMTFVFKWPHIDGDSDYSEEMNLFNSTFGVDELTADDKARNFTLSRPVLSRIKTELELHEKRNHPDSFDTQSSPYIKLEPKIGRNDPCPCGSGKKYKKCCLGKKEEVNSLM